MTVPKKAKAEEVSEEEEVKELSPEEEKALSELQTIHDEVEKIDNEACEKVLEVEREFNKKKRPVYLKRNEFIAKIPDFWVTVLGNHPLISNSLTEDDTEVLKNCTEVDVVDLEDVKNGYKITFTFKKNPFFTNTTLVKELRYGSDGSITITGTVPQWKEGMGPSDEPAVGGKRPNTRDYRFMNWWVEREELEAGNMDALADTLREDVWPHPHKLFTGELDDEEGLAFGGSDDEDDEEGEGEEGDEAEEEDA